jgi:hypothetical protein
MDVIHPLHSASRNSRLAPLEITQASRFTSFTVRQWSRFSLRSNLASQGPDLNRRRAALQAAASDQTLPPWRTHCLAIRYVNGVDWPKCNQPPTSVATRRGVKGGKNTRRRIGSPRGSRTPVLAETLVGLSSVFGMGTGVTPPLWPPQCRLADSNRDTRLRRYWARWPLLVRAIQLAPGPDRRVVQ